MSNEIQFLLYSLPDEEGKVQVIIKDETIWCTQKAMAQLFGIDKSGISRHISNIFKDEELQQDTTIAKIATVVNRGIRGEVEDLVDFYAMIQNRFHYAITGQTAAEIIYTKADHNKEHMGLTTWKNAPDGRILKSDVSIAKNYLQEKEIRQLERAVTGFFDYIEDLIERENTFNMSQFSESVNEFLTFRRYQILPDKGRISASQAKVKAESEYDIFNKTQRIDSDFDKQVRGMLDKSSIS